MNWRTFGSDFLMLFAVQLAVWTLYWSYVMDPSGGETTFQRLVLWFYWPVLFLVEAFQSSMGWRSWYSLGFLVVFGPFIGAVVYSVVLASVIQYLRRR